MNFYPRYCGDYMADTSHLAVIEHGVYTLLLDHYYAMESAMPDDEALWFRVCRAFSPDEQAAVRRVVNEFFPVCEDDGLRHNARADAEIATYHERQELSAKRAAAGAKGGSAPSKPEANDKQNDKQNESKEEAKQGVPARVSRSHNHNHIHSETHSLSDAGASLSIASTEIPATRERRKVSPPVANNPPSLEEIAAYCEERAAAGKPRIDPERFLAHYTANGWVQSSGQPIRDWHSAVWTWEKREAEHGQGRATTPGGKRRGIAQMPQRHEYQDIGELEGLGGGD